MNVDKYSCEDLNWEEKLAINIIMSVQDVTGCYLYIAIRVVSLM